MHEKFVDSLLLRGLKLIKWSFKQKKNMLRFWVERKSDGEVCPHCATLTTTIYDRRWVDIKDEPFRDRHVIYHVHKRRFFCKTCRKPFTESVPGVRKGMRVSERYRDFVYRCCERYGDLSTVRKVARCSSNFLYKTYYERLRIGRVRANRHWPISLGIDEHFFRRDPNYGYRVFATTFVDFKGSRILEVVEGKQVGILKANVAHLIGKERVKHVVTDLAEPYRSFARDYFPNAVLIADKFHVLRLLNPAINKYRALITGDKRTLPVRKLLLANGKNINPIYRRMLWRWLEKHPSLKEVYMYKEALHRLYRTHGYDKARAAFIAMTDTMANSTLPEIQTMRSTLMKWKNEILEYFNTKLTNGKTEGFNNKAKLIKRRAYGFRSFKNYRLKLLAACC